MKGWSSAQIDNNDETAHMKAYPLASVIVAQDLNEHSEHFFVLHACSVG